LSDVAHVLDDDVDAVRFRRLLDGVVDVAGRVVDGDVGAELLRALELFVARRRDDDTRPERLGDRERRGRDAAADAPGEHPLALA